MYVPNSFQLKAYRAASYADLELIFSYSKIVRINLFAF